MNDQPHDHGDLSPGPLRRQLERLHARRQEHRREAADKMLALRVHNSLIRCGLSRSDYSIASGDMFHSPQITSADTGPPGWVEVDMLPGQSPGDFARHAAAIARDLNVSRIRIVLLKAPRHPAGTIVIVSIKTGQRYRSRKTATLAVPPPFLARSDT